LTSADAIIGTYTVTETVFRHEILPVMQETATVMDHIFPTAS
jgi:hypothetical protein